MKLRVCGVVLLAGVLPILVSCGTNNTLASTTAGFLFVATQGDSSLQSYEITLATGALLVLGNPAVIGSNPTAMVIAPAGGNIFITNSGSNNLSIATVNTDATVSTVAGNPATGSNPQGITMNPAGTFLFVANQGNFTDVASGTVSVYSVQGTALTPVAGSPFSTAAIGAISGPGPVSLAVSLSGKYLYVANQFAGTVAAFSINTTTGFLTPLAASPYAVGLNPSGVTITPNGAFLYVENAGSNNVSAFGICDAITNTCSNANTPDGTLTPSPGSPFAAGSGPVSSATDPIGQYLYVVDKQSSQISQYRISSGTGALTPNSPAAVSTGTTPVGIVVRAGITIIPATGGLFDYVYATNNNGTSISIYDFDTTTGVLNVIGTPFNTISGFPSAIAVR